MPHTTLRRGCCFSPPLDFYYCHLFRSAIHLTVSSPPRMGAARRTQNVIPNNNAPSSPSHATSLASTRNLSKIHLGGVIFGCTNSTKKECLFKQLFGLPVHHFSYVKNIDPGLPLFLFNYSDRKLHGIFEAASSGQMNINSYAWAADGSERTQYPAQVQIRMRLQCHPLSEDQFKPVIVDNYFKHSHFWFELDHAQTNRLLCLLSASAVAPSTSAPQNTTKWRTLFQAPQSPDRRNESESFRLPSEEVSGYSYNSNGSLGSSDGNNQPLEVCLEKQVVEKDEKDLIYMKLKELALNRESSNSSLSMTGSLEDTVAVNDMHLDLEAQKISQEKNEESLVNSFDYPSIISQDYSEIQIRQLKDRCMMLESTSNPSIEFVNETVMESFNELNLDLDEWIFLVGGYDGVSWLSALNSFSPSHDVIKSFKSMNSLRCYASVAKLNGELYVFGGGNGSSWYDTVESYNPANNQWSCRPSLKDKKGSLAGATLNNKIFALGGGNGIECFSDVEMFDIDVGRWISTQSMLQKRFALAAAELNGALYAVGGYDGKDYLTSAERFDPREHSWTRIESMNTKRGCHSLAVLNEKLYVIGGYDGMEMIPSIEIYDPRLGSWMNGEPMNLSRGYSAATAFKESIYVIGGVKAGENIVDIVERYEEGKGWQVTNLKAIGRRSFSSAIVL
ncbi:uncharacterized protein LOC132313370 isoform X2 [Cornus florida]|uniref:uncharacterized protein LOC132313370 isoform X2 n=1 Tax=Cornus florida TaxID=4283 RepID=UPI002897E40E|nr:uncharacterized protein LOC132313370 isoform X2 [Cornus florida]